MNTTEFTPSEKLVINAKRDADWLLSIANEQSTQALSDLFEIYAPKLKGWLMERGVENDTAEVIIKDVMIMVWTNAGIFDPAEVNFVTWVYRITRNKWIDYQRKHGRMDMRASAFTKAIADKDLQPVEPDSVTHQNRDILQEHINGLPEADQRAVRMSFIDLKSHKQISDETGLPLETVRTRIHSAMSALKASVARTE